MRNTTNKLDLVQKILADIKLLNSWWKDIKIIEITLINERYHHDSQ
ncbi:hypothetical protein HYE37_02860 [Mycoplasmopsis bovis]|nr:hypothetical protein [Mycoplasmopsis bovis]QQH21353.1 hypothetical protein HYE37_02860 [Mycoplasmopsis bovis]